LVQFVSDPAKIVGLNQQETMQQHAELKATAANHGFAASFSVEAELTVLYP
jgi:hypothetical protein